MICHAMEVEWTDPETGILHHSGYPIEIRWYDPYRRKYDSAMAEYLDTQCDFEDESTGDVEWSEYVQRFGKRILYSDDRGFVCVERFATEDAAKAHFKKIDAAYGEWLDLEGEE